MRILIAAVGRLKQGPERDLAERYRKRAADAGRSLGLTGFDIVEIRESRADNTERRMTEESIAIANIISERAVERDSRRTRRELEQPRVRRAPAGMARREPARSRFHHRGGRRARTKPARQGSTAISFGAATWPHQFVRIMLLEQLYRATTILSGHPYHRG